MTFLAPLRKNSRYFQDPAGQPAMLAGYSGLDLFALSDAPYRTLLDDLSDADLNAVLLPIDLQDRDPNRWITPFKRHRGERRTPQGNHLFDLRSLNPGYWEKLSVLVKRAHRDGIFVGIALFGLPGDEAEALSASNPANHAPLDDENTGDDPPAWQCALVDAALQVAEDEGNVFFVLCGEAASSPERAKYWANYLRETTDAPPLIESERYGEASAEVASGCVGAFVPSLRPLEGLNRRIMLAECAADDEGETRRAAWRALLSGAQSLHRISLLTSEDESLAFSKSLRAAGCARRFIRERRLRYWVMNPGMAVDGETPVFSRADDRYLAMTGEDGSVTLDLSGCGGSFTLSWWEMREERLVTRGMVLAGGTRTFQAPEEGEWILDLYKKIR
jgi:hypothetical protein